MWRKPKSHYSCFFCLKENCICCCFAFAWNWPLKMRLFQAANDRKKWTDTNWPQTASMCVCVCLGVCGVNWKRQQKPGGESLFSFSVCPLSHPSQSSLLPPLLLPSSSSFSSCLLLTFIIIIFIIYLLLIIIRITYSLSTSSSFHFLSVITAPAPNEGGLQVSLGVQVIKAGVHITGARNSFTSVAIFFRKRKKNMH